ncbi:MAG: hypothetical protein ACRDWB_14315, partial [Acidimicrobiales bacterium]
SLDRAASVIESVGIAAGGGTPADRAHGELANLVTAAEALLRSAQVRTESRGAHARADFPETSDRWRRRILHTGGRVIVSGQAVESP